MKLKIRKKMENLMLVYFIFLLKLLTLMLIFLLILVLIITLIIKKNNSLINITNINNKYYLLTKFFLTKTLSKTERKKTITNLAHLQKNLKKNNKNLFIINFNGDITASEINNLKDIISLIILNKEYINEVILRLTSNGGIVTNYGLAATQLKRLKNENIYLTISIDNIAASGGYMMACVANKIIASPFSIIGSIGVLGIIPNIHKLLNKNNIEIEYHTSGKYKKTLSIISENTDLGRKKFIDSLENTHNLFKNFVKENRDNINIEDVSTGEYWYGIDALKLNLIDEIRTGDEYIFNKIKDTNIYEITINDKKNIKNIFF